MADIKKQPLPDEEANYEQNVAPPEYTPSQPTRTKANKVRRFFKLLIAFLLLISVSLHVFRYASAGHRAHRHFWHRVKHRFHPHHRPGRFQHLSDEQIQSICPVYEPLKPASDEALDTQYGKITSDPTFRNRSAALLSGAVQVNSESFDDSGAVGSDSRWDRFANLHAYLKRTFPLIHKHLTKQTANTYGLLYTWPGSDKDLKPLVLMAHQDTVPVEMNTLDQWEHAPWSGYYDKNFVYGRGAVDDKSSLISIMIAIERLIKNGFEPKRTILLSFGFDEESKGFNGAHHLAQKIESIYGKDSIEMIVDEGGGIANIFGKEYSAVSTAEKGYLDVNVTLSTPGGHSSAPPGFTNIEILSDVLDELKQIHYVPHLTPRNPHYNLLRCAAVHSPHIPKKIRHALLSLDDDDDYESPRRRYIAKRLAEFMGFSERYLLQTSQATTIMRGGVKANELPEFGFVLLNHRIAVEEDMDFVRDLTSKVLVRKAKQYGLTLKLWDHDTPIKGSMGQLEARSFGNLNPAPKSPTFGDKHFDTFAGTVQHVWKDTRKKAQDKEIVVSPNIMTGNTDTRFYWNLTKNIYRYAQIREEDALGVHTVNEKFGIDSLMTNIAFYYELVRNVDNL